jgi:hypothetical protein
MDRDVTIEGVSGGPMSLAAVPGGGFVVTGQSWAIGTNANGEVLWKYADLDPGATPKAYRRSEFHGVVPLTNGSILLCGVERTPEGSAALLTILNNAGQLAEKRLLQPPGPGEYSAVSFERFSDGMTASP